MLGKVLFSVFFVNYCLMATKVNALLHLDLDLDRYPIDQQLHKDVLDEELCQRQLTYLTTDNVLLARFLDAGIRVPRGILIGNTVDLGNYHQCLAINVEADGMPINGKYCRIRVPVGQDIHLPEILDRSHIKFDLSELQLDTNILRQLEAADNQKVALKIGLPGADMDMIRIAPDSPLRNVSFDLAVCIPRPCSTEQVMNGLLFNLTNIGFEFEEHSCRLPDDRPWVAADYVASVVFSVIGFLTVISTCYDLYQSVYLKKGSKELSSTYSSFSVYTNTRRLLTFKSSPGSVECLDGIRALSIIWVILGHSFHTVSLMANPIEAFQWTISLQAAWITVGPLTVDTFFFLSGFLLVYTTTGKFSRMQLLKNLHLFYLHRLLRMFPILAAVILFEASFFMRVSDGPLWDRVATQALKCRQYWWPTLFYVQNFVNPRDTCIGVTWYLAIDIQLHILSPIILFWVLTSKRAAWTALNTSLIATLTASTVYIFFKNFPSGVISPNREEEMLDFFSYYYVNILTRASPFLVGMIYGYLLHLRKRNKVNVPKVLTSIFLLCSLITMLLVMYCAQIAMRLDWDNQLADNFFNSFLRFLWALALGWIVFACVQGIVEPINWFLSLRMWKLPARISYAMYLIHYSIMVVYNSAVIAPIYFTVPSILFNFMAYMFTTLILSFFVTLLIDSPFSTLFKVLLGGSKRPQRSKMTVEENDPAKTGNVKGNYSFQADDSARTLQPSNIISDNDVKLSIKNN